MEGDEAEVEEARLVISSTSFWMSTAPSSSMSDEVGAGASVVLWGAAVAPAAAAVAEADATRARISSSEGAVVGALLDNEDGGGGEVLLSEGAGARAVAGVAEEPLVSGKPGGRMGDLAAG